MPRTTIRQILTRYWNYSAFRPLQEEIIMSVLEGKDTLALMPTGGGKSLCYQVPALAMDGICIVISPLIALMKDQVDSLKKRGIKAVAVHSGMSKTEVDIVFDNCVYDQEIKFLFLSPERLKTDLARERIRGMKVNLFAVDEAHCISQWGYDFRPPYLEIANIRQYHPRVPVLALTATATTLVIRDIQEKLNFPQEHVIRMSFERRNLAYMVLHEEDKLNRLVRMATRVQGSGVVYVRSRSGTKRIAEHLAKNKISADYYHAGLDGPTREQKQDDWMKGKIRVIVCTNAFGMGIDKPNVRFVAHYDIPDTLEAYFQEAGRAGRDGQNAYATLLFNDADISDLEEKHRVAFPPLAEIRNVY
ncbi:MAG: RecQ family ATP-dependent DNA helicase, partial [Bacteroidota bacterium]